jgi:hypothetical protein
LPPERPQHLLIASVVAGRSGRREEHRPAGGAERRRDLLPCQRLDVHELLRRMNWLNVKTDKDVRDKARLPTGVRPKSVKDKSLDPVVSYGPELAPTSKYIWDTLEDMDSRDCIAKCVEIDAWQPLRKPKFGKVKNIKPEQKGLNFMLKCIKAAEKVEESLGPRGGPAL